MTEHLHDVLSQLASCLLHVQAKYVCVICFGYGMILQVKIVKTVSISTTVTKI